MPARVVSLAASIESEGEGEREEPQITQIGFPFFSLSIARQISSKPSFNMRTQISMLVDRVGSHGH
jgi:hypothetical protein